MNIVLLELESKASILLLEENSIKIVKKELEKKKKLFAFNVRCWLCT